MQYQLRAWYAINEQKFRASWRHQTSTSRDVHSATVSKLRRSPSVHTSEQTGRLTLNIRSLAHQRCLPSWGPRRIPWFFFLISQLFDAVDYSNYVFLGFRNYNSVIQALLASNILCLFISTEVTGGTELLHTHSSLNQHLNNVIF